MDRVAARVILWSLLAAGGLAPEAAAGALRDPFTFGPRTEEIEQAVVVGVLWDATHPLAIIGEEPVAVGDTVSGGWRIAEIRQDGIVLQRGGVREFVRLGQPLPD